MWMLDGLDLEQDFGMGFLKNQTHKLLVSNKINFDVNSEFEESNFENFGRIYPYGVSYSKKESVTVDVIFKSTNPMQKLVDFREYMQTGDFVKELKNTTDGITTTIAYKGMSNLLDYKNYMTCTLDLYVHNIYDDWYNNALLTNQTTTITIDRLNIGRFNCISLKGNYAELRDIYGKKLDSVSKDLDIANYPQVGVNKKDASLKFVIRADNTISVVNHFKNFIAYCKPENRVTNDRMLAVEHLYIDDKKTNILRHGIFTQFTPTYLDYNNGKAWLEFTATLKLSEPFPINI